MQSFKHNKASWNITKQIQSYPQISMNMQKMCLSRHWIFIFSPLKISTWGLQLARGPPVLDLWFKIFYIKKTCDLEKFTLWQHITKFKITQGITSLTFCFIQPRLDVKSLSKFIWWHVFQLDIVKLRRYTQISHPVNICLLKLVVDNICFSFFPELAASPQRKSLVCNKTVLLESSWLAVTKCNQSSCMSRVYWASVTLGESIFTFYLTSTV